nr:DUF2339 domain-containing protein [Lachnospiraceae bacterium]
DTGDEFIRFIYIVVTVALFALNSANILSDDFQAGKAIKLNNGVANVYLGLKFTILVAVILNSIEAANYITSISLFVLAIICIVLGFWKDVKALRIYGLVLSILSVVKLIIVDITYENSIGRAVSFLVCGVLCFAISAIYNLVDKKYKDGM